MNEECRGRRAGLHRGLGRHARSACGTHARRSSKGPCGSPASLRARGAVTGSRALLDLSFISQRRVEVATFPASGRHPGPSAMRHAQRGGRNGRSKSHAHPPSHAGGSDQAGTASGAAAPAHVAVRTLSESHGGKVGVLARSLRLRLARFSNGRGVGGGRARYRRRQAGVGPERIEGPSLSSGRLDVRPDPARGARESRRVATDCRDAMEAGSRLAACRPLGIRRHAGKEQEQRKESPDARFHERLSTRRSGDTGLRTPLTLPALLAKFQKECDPGRPC